MEACGGSLPAYWSATQCQLLVPGGIRAPQVAEGLAVGWQCIRGPERDSHDDQGVRAGVGAEGTRGGVTHQVEGKGSSWSHFSLPCGTSN